MNRLSDFAAAAESCLLSLARANRIALDPIELDILHVTVAWLTFESLK